MTPDRVRFARWSVSSRRSVLRCVLTSVLLGLVPILGGCLDGASDDARRSSDVKVDCGRFAFQRDVWMADESTAGEFPSTRQVMARGLVECDALIGLKEREVRRLLGRPADHDGVGISYELGGAPGPIRIDSEFLDVDFKNGKVARSSLSIG
jgi:hypothetical protein